MEDTLFDSLLKVLMAGGSLTAGAALTALRAKLASTKEKNRLHITFYVLSGIVLLGAIVLAISNWGKIHKADSEWNWSALIILIASAIASIGLIWTTCKTLVGKHQFTSKELDPVVNKFSKTADKGNIRLLAGSLDFLGETMTQINHHPQYICLREEGFRQIQILCTTPVSNQDKMRYGKIIKDFSGTVQLRYYKPPLADLKIRGRIKTLNSVTRLLIYSKVGEKFQTLELDTADTEGARYSHLWDLIWELAQEPTQEQLDDYRNIFESQSH